MNADGHAEEGLSESSYKQRLFIQGGNFHKPESLVVEDNGGLVPIDQSQLDSEFRERYELVRPIGRGGMGHIYLAQDKLLERPAAVKFLTQGLVSAAATRFMEEARAQAQLNHPNIVTLITFSGRARIPYIIFEYVEGKSLAEIIKEKGRLPIELAIKWMDQLAKGMEYAHSKGVLHRDLKPANLLIDRESSSIRIIDFGLAKRDKRTREITNPGDVIGSPSSMAPEQAKGQKSVLQTDVYAAGIILFQMLTGFAPFDRATVSETLMAHINAPVPDPRDHRPSIPPPLAVLTKMCLEKSPFERPANFFAVRQLLAMCGKGYYEPPADTKPRRN